MDKSYVYIFFGFLAIAMGIGGDQGEIIPSWTKLSIGFVAIAYGIYLKYGVKKADQLESNLNPGKRTEGKSSKPSYIYIFDLRSSTIIGKQILNKKK